MNADEASFTVDDFTGPGLAPERWQPLAYPLPDGSTWICAEPAAELSVTDGTLALRVERFQNAHPSHQNIDNCKHLLLATSTVPVAADGETTFSVTMTAHSLNARPYEYRDGFVSFNVLDFATGMVFDICATSDRLIAIYERLPLPQVDTPYTYIVDAPLAGVDVAPGAVYHCAVTFDAAARTATWTVNGQRIFFAREILFPKAITLGLGLITLHPCHDGRSHSLRGQGLAATWRDLRVTRRRGR